MNGTNEYDVIVVGTGHAGCEAALASARMGCRTAVFTLNLDTIALMPCNPSVGGPGKGHLVREIDALGGEMARNTDRTSIQIRMLNTSKGPAVQALRAQSDKHAYASSMKTVLENQPCLDVKQAQVSDLIVEHDAGTPRAVGIVTGAGVCYQAKSVILTTGTFLRGRIVMGDSSYPGGRAGEFPADALSASLAACGFRLGRLKTGTPPRVDGRTIDYALSERQEGSTSPLFFSDDARTAWRDGAVASPGPSMPVADLGGVAGPRGDTWRAQLPCWIVQTNGETHDVIRANLSRAPMYNGGITSAGPRYCPSIETKIVRFAEKLSHQLFLEPEGWRTREVYVQGANTSLPEDVQRDMLRTIPALRHAEVMRPGYAIEYDYLPGTQVEVSLESKPIRNLFLAGQIIGTTGYEEAGALGIMAGINAARRVQDREAVVLRRDEAYIGVLIDDLVTKEMDEPYRMHTSQAEFRLLLRQDNAADRLGDLAHDLGLISSDRYARVVRRRQETRDAVHVLEGVWINPSVKMNGQLSALGCGPITNRMRAADLLSRADVTIQCMQSLGLAPCEIDPESAREAETSIKYATYVSRQEAEVRRLRRLEGKFIPVDVDYGMMEGMRTESRERLALVRPRTVGQASRVAGVAPSDISVLLVHLEREQRRAAS